MLVANSTFPRHQRYCHQRYCHQRSCHRRCRPLPIVLSLLAMLGMSFELAPRAVAQDPYAVARERLVRERVASDGVSDPRVLESIRTTPRHEFVPESERPRAYLDMALPIGNAQTISSPFIVALMTESLDPQPGDKVLEIGTGSGYQAAVLSPLVQEVYSIEIVEELGLRAAETLQRLGYENISTRVGDGFLGWPEAAPFDKIIVTCSPESVPDPLVEQLREGGQMIIPVGERYQQTLFRMTKRDGRLIREALRPTLFVPMTGEAEQERQVQPDPTRPRVINGDFERAAEQGTTLKESIPGWYYGRQVQRLESSRSRGRAAQGLAFVRFENETPGLNSHLLQGVPIDGRQVSMIRLSGTMRTVAVRQGPTQEAVPMIVITLYDEQRRDLGIYWLGPLQGNSPWRELSRLISIPLEAREAIIRIGLFGATGTADFDAIAIEAVR